MKRFIKISIVEYWVKDRNETIFYRKEGGEMKRRIME